MSVRASLAASGFLSRNSMAAFRLNASIRAVSWRVRVLPTERTWNMRVFYRCGKLCQVIVQKSDAERAERFWTDIVCHMLRYLPFYNEKNYLCAEKLWCVFIRKIIIFQLPQFPQSASRRSALGAL